jgi:carbamoyltransferase
MLIWGITALTHDAAISVIKNNEILFAAHAERYSGVKQDKYLNPAIINEALEYGTPEIIAFYENRWLKKLRQFCCLQFKNFIDMNSFPKNYLKKLGLTAPIISVKHHLSHAAAGYYTSKFEKATIVVIDAVGEWDTITIWEGNKDKISLKDKISFPSSIGLLYSAFTQRCGLKPNEEEYILMGMAAYGKKIHSDKIKEDFIDANAKIFRLRIPCHYGIGNYIPSAKPEDLAASIQEVTEDCIRKIISYAKNLINSDNLVYCGGVALNCVANNHLPQLFKNIWIMPNPGDAGASLGCAAVLGRKKLAWKGPYLGHNINSQCDLEEICNELNSGKIIGLANGKAEFGPRALGNRSLLADPRSITMKDKVNVIKKRQKFRPFAAAILAEKAKDYFSMNYESSPYMQFAFKCIFPQEFPAICHIDNTSRIQTVDENDNKIFYELLNLYYQKTGCPMLLNTSLNIRGKPIINTTHDVKDFELLYNVKIH